jgi:hypothetical protein
MFDELPIAWTTCQKAIDTNRYIVGRLIGRRSVGTMGLVGEVCPGANCKDHQSEGPVLR